MSRMTIYINHPCTEAEKSQAIVIPKVEEKENGLNMAAINSIAMLNENSNGANHEPIPPPLEQPRM